MGNTLQFCPRRNAYQEEDSQKEVHTSKKSKKGNKKTKKSDHITTSDEYSLNENLKLTLKLNQNKIRMSKDSIQTIPGMLSVEAQDFNAKKIQNDEVNYQPLDLIFVLDTSGSMSGEKIQLVKQSTIQILNFMKPTDRVCVIGFDSNAKVHVGLQSVNQNSIKQIKQTVNSLQASGGTSIARGMSEAFQIIKKRKEKNELTSIFLLSDGQDSQGYQDTLESLKNANVQDPFCIDCFGFGEDHNSNTLNQINNLKQGTFNFIRNISQINDAFTIIFAGIKTYIAQDIKLKVKFENTEIMNGITVKKTFGSEWKKLNHNSYEININHLMAGRSKDFVFELTIPSFEMQLSDQMRYQTIATAEVQAKCLNTKKIVKKNAVLTIELLSKEMMKKEKLEDDEKVMQNYFRVLAADAMEQGKKYADQGNFSQSQEILEAVYKQINSSKYQKNQVVIDLLKDLKNCQQACTANVYNQQGRGYVMNAQQVNMNQYVACNYDSKFSNSSYINFQCNGGQERFRSLAQRQYQYNPQ